MTTEADPSLGAAAQLLEVFRALANPVRLGVLQWLRDPELRFPRRRQSAVADEVGGVAAPRRA
jgi:hypothetical protein